MPDLGKVTIFQPNRTTLVSSNFKPKPNVSLAEINDVSIEGVQDGYSLVFDSANNRFEMKTVTAAVGTVDGGTF